ncbi:hypothetical protein KI387_040733, partial [Taxus chinensis]
MAKVRSCIPMLDLDCDDLILHMFEVFFVVLHDDHSQKIMVAMQTILSLVLNEYEDPPQPLLSMLEEGLRQEESCIAHTLAKGVLDQCSSKVKAYMLARSPMKQEGSALQGMSHLVFGDKLLISNACIQLGDCTKKSDLIQEEVKEEEPLNENKQGKGSLLIEEVSFPFDDCMHNDKVIMEDESKKKEKLDFDISEQKKGPFYYEEESKVVSCMGGYYTVMASRPRHGYYHDELVVHSGTAKVVKQTNDIQGLEEDHEDISYMHPP